MERKEYPNGVSVETDVGENAMLVARVFVDDELERTYESENAHDEAGVYARVLVRVRGHRALRKN